MSTITNRTARERGAIIWMLGSNRGQTFARSFIDLQRDLRTMNYPLNAHDLRDHLESLAMAGYLDLKRRCDIPGFTDRSLRGDETPDQVATVKLTAKGVYLYEGHIRDEGVEV